MNRLSVSQITASFAAILLGAGGALLFGASPVATFFPVVGGLIILLISAGPREPSSQNVTKILEPVPDLLDHPQLGLALEAITDPLMMMEAGRILHANRAAQRLLGKHIKGADARIAIRHPAAAERLANLAPMTEAISVDLIGLGGRDQHWQMRVAPIGNDRRLVHLVDRSSTHAAEKMRVDFVANASHELRTPLAGILGFIETLADPDLGKDDETRQRFLKIMDGEARRMQRLVEDLMSLSRIEAEKYRLPTTAIDMAALIKEVVDVFHTSHGERGLDVEMTLTPEIPRVQGDRVQLSQLLHNLIGNSVKYAHAGTPISVKLLPGPSGMSKLIIADQGDGIGPDHLPRLTERFYRVDSGRSRTVGGTGLGLAIVKHIVERHRGRIDIASTLGKGTTVTILLPHAQKDDAAES